MRSSVSYMLSHSTVDTIMSKPDYEQNAHHHGSVLVLVRGIGPSKPRFLQKVFERLQKVNNVKINDSSGQVRDIWVRFVQDHPVENNDWGDFQTHRRLLGLLTVGKFESQVELNELCRVHESLKVKYTDTLFDSRCFLFFGKRSKKSVDAGNNLITEMNDIEHSSLSSHGSSNKENNSISSDNSTNDGSDRRSLDHEINKKLDEEFTTPSNFKSQAFFYLDNDPCDNLESSIAEFIHSLFWILESKRLERTREKIEKVSLLYAPFEKKDFVGLDLDTRNNRKRCMGRATKNLADLTLQCGLVSESLTLYHTSCETLRAIGDSLWLGAAYEGLCSASSILLYPNVRYATSLQRNASLQGSPQKITDRPLNQDNIAKAALSKKSGLVIQLESDTLVKSSSSSSTSSVSSILSSSSSGSTLSDKKDTPTSPYPPNVLLPDDIPLKYRDAIINYSKYRHAGIIETEAALKAARICIEQNQNLEVAIFLQNVLYINLNMSEPERVQRFETLTELYQRIGYHRKASFCQRLAAWRHVAQSNTNPDWAQSYQLMLESFPGHHLSTDPIEVLDQAAGWPCLQIDLLQQLIGAARRLGQSALATRHMTFLLQTMWKHLTPNEQREMALQLQSLSAQCEGSPVPLVLDNGTVIPPANLTDLPYCIHFQVQNLPSHLQPHKIAVNKVDCGPFLFTPIHFSSIDRRVKKNDSKIAFQWVQNDLCEILLKLLNPLPFELRVSDMRLLTNGVVFESLPETVVLPTTTPTSITLHGTPIEHGSLEVQGYSTHTLGVKSNCRLKAMSNRKFPPNYTIDVIPALPKIVIATSLPQTATFSSLANSDYVIVSASVTIFNGETSECTITLTNNSNVTIEFIEESLHSTVDSKLQSRIFQWSREELQSKLPILPQRSIDFKVTIYGEADFLGPLSNGIGAVGSSEFSNHNAGSHLPEFHSLSVGTLSVSGQNSLPSRMSSPVNIQRRSELTSSFRSTHSGHSSLATISLGGAGSSTTRHMDVQFRFRYSGGEAFKEGYCRMCAVSFNLEFLPSAQVTNWDVLPAEIPSQFYLVLDVVNLTAQEMSLNYTTNKNILVESKESCRVPVPVERCPLERLLQENTQTSDPQNSLLSGGTDVDVTERACSEHISDQVNLKWTLTGTETCGVTSLRGISLSPTMLGLITVAPLQWGELDGYAMPYVFFILAHSI
ncbi:Protein brunelleschi [Pseudolycoriella hygida]|uniref:Protein brunelleschi n=1 Tax=Pseudolycoriella hygida TaxID=35572 RepID=A0A9Q0RUG5_9DIPT|nr:Protein brunelleschi [Pseudolycoriella hygida]